MPSDPPRVPKAIGMNTATNMIKVAESELRREVDSAFAAHEQRLEVRLSTITTALENLRVSVEDLREGRIAAAVLEKTVEVLSKQHDALVADVGNMDGRLDAQSNQITQLQTQISGLKDQIAAISSKDTKERVKDAGIGAIIVAILPALYYVGQMLGLISPNVPPPPMPQTPPAQVAPAQPQAPAPQTPSVPKP